MVFIQRRVLRGRAWIEWDREDTQMTKRHFEKFATMLRELGEEGADDNTLTMVASCMSTIFHDDNPRFDTSRFLQAAGRMA
jgi:hypothetical protein